MYKDAFPSQEMLTRMKQEGGSLTRTGPGVRDWKFIKTPTSISEALSQEDRPMAERLNIANRMRMEQEQIQGLKEWERKNVPGMRITGQTGGLSQSPKKAASAGELFNISGDLEKLKAYGFTSKDQALAEARRLAEQEEEEYGLGEFIKRQSERKPQNIGSSSGKYGSIIDSSYGRMMGYKEA